MKTIRLVLSFLLTTVSVFATPTWEVGVVVFGNDENAAFQEDADRNILELARVSLSENLKLGLYRELSDNNYSFFPDPKSENLFPWDDLFFKVPYAGIKISGAFEKNKFSLEEFLKNTFRNPNSKRLLIVYGHGFGYNGLKAKTLLELKLLVAKLKLDILWFDSCFMGTVEVARELQDVAQFLISSQDAEFSSGIPYERLNLLLNSDDLEDVSKKMAESYLESYSYLKKGSQRKSVARSPATISVIDFQKLPKLISYLKKISDQIKTLSDRDRQILVNRLQRFTMDELNLVDVGGVFAVLNNTFPKKQKTNARLFLESPFESGFIVYGYENWTRGFERDLEILEKLPAVLSPVVYVDGPNGKKWPARRINKALALTPFTVGTSEFNYYFVDQKTSDLKSVARSHDTIVVTTTYPDDCIRFYGYTQGVGKYAERYSGLSVVNPFKGVPNLDYLKLEFFKDTGWGG